METPPTSRFDEWIYFLKTRLEGEARCEARVLELMADGYSLEQIREILKDGKGV